MKKNTNRKKSQKKMRNKNSQLETIKTAGKDIQEVIRYVKDNLNVDFSDFGEEPIFFSRIFRGSELGVMGVISSFLLASAFSPLTGISGLIILANDWMYIKKKSQDITIDVTAKVSNPDTTPISKEKEKEKEKVEDEIENEIEDKIKDKIEDGIEDEIEIEDEIKPKIKYTDMPESKKFEENNTQFGLISKMLNSIFFNIPSHLVLHANTRCGKTLTLRAIIYLLLQNPGGRENQVRIIDFKNSIWMGLEETKAVITLCKNGRIEIDPLIAEINKCYKTFCDRVENRKYKEPRLWLIIDEWYRTLPKIKDREDGKEILEKINDIAQLGLEYGIHLLLVVQNHQCQAFGFDSQARFAFRFLSVGRENDYRSIESMLNDNYMIPSMSKRQSSKKSLKDLLINIEEKVRPLGIDVTTGEIDQFPDFQWLEDYTFPETILARLGKRNDLSASNKYFASPPQNQSCLETKLEPHLNSILQYIKRKGATSSRQIQQAKLAECQNFKKNEIDLCLDNLERNNLINSITLESIKYYKVVDSED